MKLPESIGKYFKERKKLLGVVLILALGILLIFLSAITSADEVEVEEVEAENKEDI